MTAFLAADESMAIASPLQRPEASEPASARALLLFNPRSRRAANALPTMTRALERNGLEVEVARADTPSVLSETLAERGPEIDRILLAGGDGTIHRALPDLVAQSRPVGLLPLGTANDFARSVGIPFEAEAACAVAARGQPRRVDLGEVNDIYYCNVAHIGLGVQVVHGLSPTRKRLLGPLEYLRSILDALQHRRAFAVDVIDDRDRHHCFEAVHVAVGNGRFYGAGSVIETNARIDDGRLDLYSIDPQPVSRLLRLGPALRQGHAGHEHGVRRLGGTHLAVNTGTSLPIETDGEIRTQTPARFRVLPDALRVLAPA